MPAHDCLEQAGGKRQSVQTGTVQHSSGRFVGIAPKEAELTCESTLRMRAAGVPGRG